VIFIQQGGRNRHEHICESLELFASRVLPDFRARAEARMRRKEEELAPAIEKALARKSWMRPLRDEEIPELVALGRQVVQQTPELADNTASRASGLPVPLADPLAGSR
jgi:hypothetical protein